MSTDNLRPARPGEPVWPRVSDAETFNFMLEGAKAARGLAGERKGGGGPLDLPTPSPANTVLLVAHDGLPRGAVVGIDGPAGSWEPARLKADASDRPRGKSKAPVAGEAFAILTEPAGKAGQLVRAAVSGAALVKISTPGGVAGAYADVIAGETGKLLSGDSGPAYVLWSEADADPEAPADERWATVTLSGAGAGYAQLFATAGAESAGYTKGTLTSVLGSKPSDGKTIYMHPLNPGKFTVGRVYPVWPTSVTCKAGVGPADCPAVADGAAETYTFTPGTLPPTFVDLEGDGQSLIHGEGCAWTGEGWALDLEAGTLTGTTGPAGEYEVVYHVPDGFDLLADVIPLDYDSNTGGELDEDFPPIIELARGDPCTGDVADEANDAPARRVYLADPWDDCAGQFTGDLVVCTNVAVACVGGVLTTTQTKSTVHVECGRITGVTTTAVVT